MDSLTPRSFLQGSFSAIASGGALDRVAGALETHPEIIITILALLIFVVAAIVFKFLFHMDVRVTGKSQKLHVDLRPKPRATGKPKRRSRRSRPRKKKGGELN